MRIWFTEIGEPLPIEQDVRLHRYGMLTRALASYGHEVVWWTSNFSHAPKRFVVEADREETVDGVKLRILRGLGYRRNVSVARLKHQAHFARRFAELAPAEPKPDVIVSPIPTIEAAHAVMDFARPRNIPVIVDVRDEWPEEFVRLAPRPFQPLGRLVLAPYYRKTRQVCENATGIVAISERQLQYGLGFARRPQRATDGVFPLGYSLRKQDPEKVNVALRFWREQGVREDVFVACFFGTMGKFFDLDTVLDAAARLLPKEQFQFVLCGDGSDLARLKEKARGLSHVLFPGWVDAPQIEALMRLSHVGLAPYAERSVAMSLPNKPFEYFSGSLPVVSSIQGELRQLLEQEQCGLTYRAGIPADFARVIRQLQEDPDLRKQMGERGRALLENRFSMEGIFRRLGEHLTQVAQGGLA